MVRLLSLVFFVFFLLSPDASALNLDEAKQAMVRESIASYPGSCACPYSTARNGSRCGGRSAYSKPGGAAPLCYPDDISEAMVADYLRRTGQRVDPNPKR